MFTKLIAAEPTPRTAEMRPGDRFSLYLEQGLGVNPHFHLLDLEEGFDFRECRSSVNSLVFASSLYTEGFAIQSSMSDDQLTLVNIALGDSCWQCGTINGQPGKDDLVQLNPGSEFALDFGPRALVYNTIINTRELERRLAHLIGQRARKNVSFEFFDPNKNNSATISGMARDLATLSANGDASLDFNLCRQNMEDLFYNTLLCTGSHSLRHLIFDNMSAASPWYVKRAEEYMDANLAAHLNLDAVADELDIAVRTLTSGFKKFRGYTPMEFLRQRRLEKVRAELRQALPSTNVTRVAFSWGFAHLGRFSKYYQQAFGELPSATLKQGRRNAS
ncbi:MAG: helix-turn-helix transcriptional regulator [Kordiimonadaceae bacterium]|nr:helix-turn-helix transcriptional regulator [Kordiimonadaceae bacterium]